MQHLGVLDALQSAELEVLETHKKHISMIKAGEDKGIGYAFATYL